jgi:hypothetical protein
MWIYYGFSGAIANVIVWISHFSPSDYVYIRYFFIEASACMYLQSWFDYSSVCNAIGLLKYMLSLIVVDHLSQMDILCALKLIW